MPAHKKEDYTESANNMIIWTASLRLISTACTQLDTKHKQQAVFAILSILLNL